MAVEAVRSEAAPAIEARARPYAPSWLDRLLDAIEALPGPAAVAFLVIGAVLVLLLYAEPWAMGVASPFTPVERTYWGIAVAAQLWAAAYLRRVAGSAFDAFKAALPASEAELARLRYELTVIPAVPAIVATVAAIALSAISLAVNPSATGTVPLTGTRLGAAFVLQSVVVSLMFVLLLQLVRQMGQVRRALAGLAIVDAFRPGPLHAFSRLTARTGIAVLLFTGSFIVIAPPPAATEPGALLVGWVPYLVFPPLIAVLAFVLPLSGMHGRLVAEKERLQGQAEERLQRLFAETNRDIDARDLSRADALNKMLTSQLQQRDVLAKLPTWPWSAGTLRGFVTAILLPLVVFLLQQVVSRLI